MKRQAKSLQKKSRKHQVEIIEDGFLVTSGSSKKEYFVKEFVSGFQCSCKWATYHDTRKKQCSHVLSVMSYLEDLRGDGTKLSFWADRDSAEKQKHSAVKIGLGLYQTDRRV